MKNIKYTFKTLQSALRKAEHSEWEEDTITAYEFASAMTGLSKADLKRKVGDKDAVAEAGEYCFDRNSVLKLILERDEDADEREFAASLLHVSKDRLYELLEEYEEEHKEYHVEISCECSSMSVFNLTVTGKELERLKEGDSKFLKKLFAKTVRTAIKDRDFEMDYAVYDEDEKEDIVEWRR